MFYIRKQLFSIFQEVIALNLFQNRCNKSEGLPGFTEVVDRFYLTTEQDLKSFSTSLCTARKADRLLIVKNSLSEVNFFFKSKFEDHEQYAVLSENSLSTLSISLTLQRKEKDDE